MIKQTLDSQMLKISEIQSKHQEELLNMQNVVGVSIGHNIKNDVESDKPVISVLVSHKLDKGLLGSADLIPAKLDGIETDVVETGELFAGNLLSEKVQEDEIQDFEQVGSSSPFLTRRIRPAMGGYSIGHPKITAGTLGTCCYDLTPFPSKPDKYYILSNNHVLANSNNAKIGDPILQPGPSDGGRAPGDIIARLSRFIPIRFMTEKSKPCNYVDAAIAEGNLRDLNREVYWGGYIKKLYAAPKVGDIVQKTGRTTGFTTGKVTNINATVNVNYGNGKIARFCRQIVTDCMSRGGDSGSIVMNREEGAVGLLFAGSATRTILNNILYVQALLRIRVTEI
ncbi:hypothetical protein QQ008_03315 [Fulvivirgaceae bacterium BMA10]|uniref:Serine protease n=1 Tax=Splendidivirga corallicola TaxID=3051826 RepID=A0ABT8KI19_9BACT|nr:hypothetical protein [Fulvivirgaceae bacterium BMA10]